ncbi:DUF2029 domain-containing protein, partial [Patescibacteria group bacterium]|nr:DUF2029 domain-containing protein [Patescibacteria group bacterium]
FGLNAISSPLGLKLSALVYTALAVIALGLLALNTKKLSRQNLATLLFAVTALLAHNLFLDEIFRATVIDILPTMLLLAALLSTRRRLWLLAGLLAGLSLSAKFAPAIFFIWLFIRRRPNWRFFGGVSVGLLPIIPFLIWDTNAFIANVFTHVLIKSPDSTSLQAILPNSLHFIPSAVFLASALLFLLINFHQPIPHRRLAVHFTLLLIIAAATYREVHNNHLIFSLPFIALILAWYRHRLDYVIRRTLTWLNGTCPQ